MLHITATIKAINSAICWKLLKLSVPKCENLIDEQWTISREGPTGNPQRLHAEHESEDIVRSYVRA
jgi:hypothetical protein